MIVLEVPMKFTGIVYVILDVQFTLFAFILLSDCYRDTGNSLCSLSNRLKNIPFPIPLCLAVSAGLDAFKQQPVL